MYYSTYTKVFCRNLESNQGQIEFQSIALSTELSRLSLYKAGLLIMYILNDSLVKSLILYLVYLSNTTEYCISPVSAMTLTDLPDAISFRFLSFSQQKTLFDVYWVTFILQNSSVGRALASWVKGPWFNPRFWNYILPFCRPFLFDDLLAVIGKFVILISKSKIQHLKKLSKLQNLNVHCSVLLFYSSSSPASGITFSISVGCFSLITF